jgi:hypothetical protein
VGADNGPKSVNRCGPVGVSQSNFYPDTLDGGTATATPAVFVATTVDQCFFDDNPARKGWSRSCGFVSIISGTVAFLSSTASINQNFADAKKERADARKETALRFHLQDLHRQHDRLERQRDRLEDREKFRKLFAVVEMMNTNLEVQAVKPRMELTVGKDAGERPASGYRCSD